MSGWARWPTAVIAVAAVLLCVSEAQASRFVLLTFSGRKADVLRAKVAEALEQAGHTVVLSKSPSKRMSSAQVKRLAKRGKADALVAGRVQRGGVEDWTLALQVVDAGTGKAAGKEIRFSSDWLPGLTKELADSASQRVEAALGLEESHAAVSHAAVSHAAASKGRAAEQDPTALDEPAPSSEPTQGSDAGTELEPIQSGSALEDGAVTVSDRGTDDASGDGNEEDGVVVRLRARGGFIHRTLDFSDDIYNRLRVQRTNLWVYQVDGALYPFERPIGERLGLIASYEAAFAGSVHDSDFGGDFPVTFQEFFGGLRARYPLGKNEIAFDLTFGRMNSGLEDKNKAAHIPDMSYTVLRASLDFSLELGPVRAVGSGGFRLPLGYGEISNTEWFPRVGGYGFEASLGLEYPVSKRVSLEVLGSLRRYLLEMNSEPDDAISGKSEVAGGAVDLYLSSYFGVSFKL